jgi:hypothetical protein
MNTMNTNRSANYLKSIVNDQSALAEIRRVQASARIFNLEQKLLQAKDPAHIRLVQRVDYFGRLGKNNPAAIDYQERAQKQRRNYNFGANPYQRIAIADAASIDIYIRTYRHESCARNHFVNLTTGEHYYA